MTYKFATLDPRPIDAAKAANEAVFTSGPVYGVEVTIPALASRCVTNLDPQHAGGNADRAAIEEAVICELPPEGAVLATVRADLDSVGAMAVIMLRNDGVDLTPEMLERVRQVAESDRFSRGGWPGVRPLPTTDNPWPEETAGAGDSRPLVAIAAAVSDFKLPMEGRVRLMATWLTSGEEPTSYREQVEKERSDMIRALETGQISVSTAANDRIAVVESTHRAAMTVGYSQAPVVVALNPAFKLGGGEPHKKFTVAQFTPGYLDLKAALAELASREPGWGGSPTIGGSPQGVSSRLTTDEVVAVVEKYLRG